MVSCNVSGPRRVAVGACRDFLLGVRFVDGRGRVVKNGGRVMKNVTGYDLVKLMAGSYGTLGVLTEVALKVLPMAEASATLRLRGLSDAQAVEAMTAALGSPFDVTGAAHAGGETLVRVEGFGPSVAYRTERLTRLLEPFGAAEAEADTSAWEGVRDVRAFHGRAGAVWRVSVKPSDGPGLAAALAPEAAVYDWGGGLVWLLIPEGEDARAAEVRAEAAKRKGHATLVRASAPVRAAVGAFQPEAPALAAISDGIRAKFDPRGVLNPGRMRG